MRYRFLLYGFLVFVAGCHESPTAGLVDQAIQIPGGCDDCWYSSRDNPTLFGTDILSNYKSPNAAPSDPLVLEAVTRVAEGFVTSNFELNLSVLGGAHGAVSTNDLLPVPAWTNTWTAKNEGITTYPWTANGVSLGYDKSQIAVTHLGGWNQVSRNPAVPAAVQLDPAVLLVPIQVVRAQPPANNFFAGLAKGDQIPFRNLFDGAPLPDFQTVNVSHPDEPIASARHANPRLKDQVFLPWLQPDPIWAQCGIQFRMVDCGVAGKGCPNLPVDALHMAPTSCEEGGLRNFQTARDNRDAAQRLPGVRNDVPLAVVMARVSGECSNGIPLDVGEVGFLAAGLAPSGRGSEKWVLAHELGHVLGLDDVDAVGRLMSAYAENQSDLLTPDECRRARVQAAQYVKNYWGLSIDPGTHVQAPNFPNVSNQVETTDGIHYRVKQSLVHALFDAGVGWQRSYDGGRQTGYVLGQIHLGNPIRLVGVGSSDTILSIDGVQLTSDNIFLQAVQQAQAAASFDVVILRGGQLKTLSFTWF